MLIHVYADISIPGHSFTGSRTIKTINSRLVYRVVLTRVPLMYGLCATLMPNKNKTTSLAGSGPVAVL